MSFTSEQFLKAISNKLPTGTNVRVRLPYTEATFEFDNIPISAYIYLKDHSDCIDSSFEYAEDECVNNAKLTFKCVGEEQYYENV